MESGRIRTAPGGHLHANRNEIFARTPAVTKEMLQKLQNAELGPKKAHLCGYDFNIRQISILIALFFLFALSSGIGYIFWYTEIFRNVVLQNLVISNQSDLYYNFVNPSPSLVRIYIYNYTNVREVATGEEPKLRVEELGPWVYEDRMHRTNINFSDDGTYVRYQEGHSYKFSPELSKGRMQIDRVTVPNIPMLSGAAMFRRSYFLTRLGMSTLFKQLNAEPFVTVGADRFILGYDDELFTLARNMMALTRPFPFDKFGLLATRRSSPDWIEMWTGKDDINKLGTVRTINNKSRMDNWDDEESDNVNGVDGVLYPPENIHNKQSVDYLYKDFCRKAPMEFVEETKILGGTMPAYRYEIPVDAFSHPSIGNPKNQGYCSADGTCAPHGLWNATKCSFGTPIFVSLPHFLGADPKLREAVEGVTPPKKELHQTRLEFHPYMGFIMQGWNRIQTNIQVQKSFGMSELGMFEDDIILPVAWMEFGAKAEEHPDYIMKIFNDSTYLVNGVDLGFKFGSILMMAVTAMCFFIVLLRNKRNKVSGASSMEIIS